MSRAEGVIAVTEGAGKSWHTVSTTWSGTAKEDQVTVQGIGWAPKYSAVGSAISTATSASHLFAIEGDGTNYIHLTYFSVEQVAAAGSATLAQLQLFRTTTASTTGTALNPRPWDGADTNPWGGRAVSLPGGKGTEGNQLWQRRMALSNAAATTAAPNRIEWSARTTDKAIIVGPAVTDGIVLKIVTGIASATVDYYIEFFVTSAI